MYEVLASVSSLGQGERGQRPGWVALAPPPPTVTSSRLYPRIPNLA